MKFIFPFLLLLCSWSAHASVTYYLVAVPEPELRVLEHDKARLMRVVYSDGENSLYLDKLWHGLHWILARDAGTTKSPRSQILLGGREFGPDLGYGKARYFTATEVKTIAALLASIKVEHLRKNYLPKVMDAAQVYPDDWVEWERSGDDGFGMLTQAFAALKDFYGRAAKSGRAVVFAWG